MSPRWSPDGRYIATYRVRADGLACLVVRSTRALRTEVRTAFRYLNPDMRPATGVMSYVAPAAPAWRPDGTSICVEQPDWIKSGRGMLVPGTGLVDVQVPGLAERIVATHPHQYGGSFPHYVCPKWSPDGRRIAFECLGPTGQTAIGVAVLGAATATTPSIRSDQWDDAGWPTWSPDGITLAFRQGVLPGPAADRGETVRFMSPGNPRADARAVVRRPASRITTRGERVGGLAWSPDGRQVAYVVWPNPPSVTGAAVYLARSDGSGDRRLSPADGAAYAGPVWLTPRQVGMVRAGRRGTTLGRVSTVTMAWVDLGRVAGDDIDWSPDRRSVAVCQDSQPGPGAPVLVPVE